MENQTQEKYHKNTLTVCGIANRWIVGQVWSRQAFDSRRSSSDIVKSDGRGRAGSRWGYRGTASFDQIGDDGCPEFYSGKESPEIRTARHIRSQKCGTVRPNSRKRIPSLDILYIQSFHITFGFGGHPYQNPSGRNSHSQQGR